VGSGIGRTLIGLGAVLIVVGLLVSHNGAAGPLHKIFGERLPLRLGRLPGDLEIRGKNGVFYFPLVTCLLVSAALSLVLWLLGRR
jgi:hypothetical protein